MTKGRAENQPFCHVYLCPHYFKGLLKFENINKQERRFVVLTPTGNYRLKLKSLPCGCN
ncbi:hypothetical protein [Desulfosporosinus hippei]|uniref:hypothetical protein n=1 Tax=Desulfosporosinus hippei TaxID=569859 RepID=UPI001A9A58AB|nr:hypothetical protein [Desulfosporosinus hippei]